MESFYTTVVAPEASAPSSTSPSIAEQPVTGDRVPADSDATTPPPTSSTAPELADKGDNLEAPASPMMVIKKKKPVLKDLLGTSSGVA